MSTRSEYDVVVVGAGIAGAAVFRRLCDAGHSVVLIEEKLVCQGATAFAGGIVRSFHLEPWLSELALGAIERFEDSGGLERARGLFTETGFIRFVRHQDAELARAEVRRLQARTALEWLEVEAARKRFPYLRLDDCAGAVFEPGAGRIDPWQACHAWIDAGRRQGGVLMEGVQVSGLVERRTVGFDGVRCSAGEIGGRVVVLCAGIGTIRLLDGARLPHSLYPKAVQVFQLDARAPANHPSFVDDVLNLNGGQRSDGSMLLGVPVGPAGHDGSQHRADFGALPAALERARSRFSWSDRARLTSAYFAYDTFTSDRPASVRYVDQARTVILASGFNGGGIKFAPAVAERVADHVSDRL